MITRLGPRRWKRLHRLSYLATSLVAKSKQWSGELRVVATRDETHDVRTFRLAPPGGGALPFTHRPGQYLNLALVIDGERVNRSYTIASAPTHPEYCEITVKKASDGFASSHLHEMLREGATGRIDLVYR